MRTSSFDDLSILDVMRSPDKRGPVDSVVVTTPDQAQHFIVDGRYRPPLPIGAPPNVTQLLRACWRHHPDSRPGFIDIVERLESTLAAQPRGDFPCGVANFANIADDS